MRALIAGVSVSVATMAATGLSAPVSADEILSNGGFDSLSGPGQWSSASETVDMDTFHSLPASWNVPIGSGTRRIHQTKPLPGGAEVDASVYVRSDVDTTAKLRLEYLDSGFAQVGADEISLVLTPGAGFSRLGLEREAPSGTEWVTFAIEFTGGATGTAWVDTASLWVAVAPTPTPTPTAPATPSSTPTLPATPINTVAATPTGIPATATSTLTAKPTITPNITGTPTTPVPTSTTQPSQAPAGGSSGNVGPFSGGPLPGYSPAGPGVHPDTSGGLLINGGFETAAGGEPATWANYGGAMYLTEGSHGGNYAVSFVSRSNSTKWIHQVVPVTAGEWYEFSAWSIRESGDGEAFLRLSFYASGDGSGSTFAQSDSTTTTTAATWTYLTTGPVKAPAGARSVRARLMIRPVGPYSAAFDDARLVVASPPVPTPTATATPTGTATPTRTPKPTATKATATPRTSGTPRPQAAPQPVAAFIHATGTVQINEIMYDGDGDPDHAYEWVELHNTGSESVSLASWSIADAKSSDALPAVEIPAGGFVVVAGSAFAGDVPGVVLLGDSRIGSGLNNNGDTVTIYDPAGNIVDQVTYGEGERFVDSAGKTIGRAPDGEWLMTLSPTPGEPNLFARESPTETPAASSTTAPVSTRTAVPATPAQPAASDGKDDHPIPEQGGDTNPLAWLALGAVGSIGLFAAGSVGRRRLQALLEKRRGR